MGAAVSVDTGAKAVVLVPGPGQLGTLGAYGSPVGQRPAANPRAPFVVPPPVGGDDECGHGMDEHVDQLLSAAET